MRLKEWWKNCVVTFCQHGFSFSVTSVALTNFSRLQFQNVIFVSIVPLVLEYIHLMYIWRNFHLMTYRYVRVPALIKKMFLFLKSSIVIFKNVFFSTNEGKKGRRSLKRKSTALNQCKVRTLRMNCYGNTEIRARAQNVKAIYPFLWKTYFFHIWKEIDHIYVSRFLLPVFLRVSNLILLDQSAYKSSKECNRRDFFCQVIYSNSKWIFVISIEESINFETFLPAALFRARRTAKIRFRGHPLKNWC